MNKCGVAASLSIAVASFLLLSPLPARAAGTNMPSAGAKTAVRAAQREAAQMTSAEASLDRGLDARKDKPGERFEAKLRETVHLKNGPELPNGTTLIGTVTADQMKANGTSRLALRFTEARLRDGRTVPIRATIIDVSPQPEYGYDIDPGTEASATWSGKTLQVDEVGALSGVDLHSRIGAKNSGVFVSNKKDNMKLSPGTRLTLAIAASRKQTA